MIQFVYSVYDSAARVYCRPFYVPNDAVALRSFAAGANDATTELGRHPADFTLFKLGEFNDDSGALVAYNLQVNLGKGIDHVRENASQPVSDEAYVQPGAEGGNPPQFVRQVTRS